MSIESAEAFLEKLKRDESFRVEFTKHDNKKDFIKKSGFDFTDEELTAIKYKLTDTDLHKVAGGGFSCSNASCEQDQELICQRVVKDQCLINV